MRRVQRTWNPRAVQLCRRQCVLLLCFAIVAGFKRGKAFGPRYAVVGRVDFDIFETGRLSRAQAVN